MLCQRAGQLMDCSSNTWIDSEPFLSFPGDSCLPLNHPVLASSFSTCYPHICPPEGPAITHLPSRPGPSNPNNITILQTEEVTNHFTLLTYLPVNSRSLIFLWYTSAFNFHKHKYEYKKILLIQMKIQMFYKICTYECI